MPIPDSWFRDLPQQFLGLPKIEALVQAFARQLQEIEQVFTDLNEKTDLETATGQNLDYIGTIIPLSRKEAGILAGADNPEYVMSDDRYRLFLKYRRLLNTNECTYYDIMEGLRLLWNVFPVYYAEDPEQPATIILTLPLNEIDGTPAAVGEVPMVKPAGVGLRFHYLTRIVSVVEMSRRAWVFDYEFAGTKPETVLIGTMPGNGGIPAVVKTGRRTIVTDFPPASEADGLSAGTMPDYAAKAVMISVRTETGAVLGNVSVDFVPSGEEITGVRPETEKQAKFSVIDAGAGVKAESFHVDYQSCGTGFAGN